METQQTPKLNEALAKARGKFPPIQKGRTATVAKKSGGSFSYDYADLADVLDVVEPILAQHGLILIHEQETTRDPLGVDTVAVLLHESGEEKRGGKMWLPCSADMQPTQSIGSASTYGRRYTTGPILGISPEADDDGNGASGNDAETRQKPAKPTCPKCGKAESVIPGKEEFGGGWLCWKKAKSPGCGHEWETAERKFCGSKALNTNDAPPDGSHEEPTDRPALPPKKKPHAGLVAILTAMVGQGNVAGNEIVIEHFGSTRQACLDDMAIAESIYNDISARAQAVEADRKCNRKDALSIVAAEILEAHQKASAKK